FYFFTWLIGLGAGYWAVFVTNAAEQFGTNIRSTVSNTVPNFVRGALVPMGWVFAFLYPKVGMTYAALFIGITVSVVAIYATFQIEETYGKDLDYVEE
ncbi:MAG TPA: MFS transporter, partial [Bacteroidetes bacterium]|nr:MFS transporter [Bacteroidota bacterium]